MLAMKRSDTSRSSPIGQRLKLEMKKRGVTSGELAKKADVKTSFIYDVISGKSANPSTVKLARVADSLGISLTTLVDGSDAGREEARLQRMSEEDYITVPRILVEVSAGGGTIVTREEVGESYYFRKQWIRDHLKVNPGDLRMLSVRGDSMEPTLNHNDLILVDTSKKAPSPPGIFIVFDGFGLVVKRVEYAGGSEPDRIRLISDNAQYSTYERSLAETFIIGRVVWFAREM
jgi:phage repressor protein C with HTH and peptisase S24 domain